MPVARWAVLARFLAEVFVIIPAYFAYFLVRGFVEGEEAEAINRAVDVVELEQALGMFWEPDLQQEIFRSDFLINLSNWTYIWGHWPVIASVALWLFFFHRPSYPIYRNAFIISGAIGLIVFTLFPTAPPRMLEGWGFVDTITERSHAYRTFQPPAFVNQYAAMPSLHFGWNLLVSIAVVRHASPIGVKLLGVVMPVAGFLGIILTANHFILDGISGGILALFGLAIALALSSLASGWRDAGPPERALSNTS